MEEARWAVEKECVYGKSYNQKSLEGQRILLTSSCYFLWNKPIPSETGGDSVMPGRCLAFYGQPMWINSPLEKVTQHLFALGDMFNIIHWVHREAEQNTVSQGMGSFTVPESPHEEVPG